MNPGADHRTFNCQRDIFGTGQSAGIGVPARSAPIAGSSGNTADTESAGDKMTHDARETGRDQSEQRWMTVRDVAEALQVSRYTVERWVGSGR